MVSQNLQPLRKFNRLAQFAALRAIILDYVVFYLMDEGRVQQLRINCYKPVLILRLDSVS